MKANKLNCRNVKTWSMGYGSQIFENSQSMLANGSQILENSQSMLASIGLTGAKQ